MSTRIALIGGGNMATSLVGGLIAAGTKPASIIVAEPDTDRCTQLSRQFDVATTKDNLATLLHDVVVLSVKPQLMQTVCTQLASSTHVLNPLYVSIAAGIRSADIARWLGDDAAVVRCMPNTPALIQCSATALYANKTVTEMQKQRADEILHAVGITTWVADEDLLDGRFPLSCQQAQGRAVDRHAPPSQKLLIFLPDDLFKSVHVQPPLIVVARQEHQAAAVTLFRR